jgi:predicted glycogen debranching enzyme
VIKIDCNACGIDDLLKKEWLETNGLGGYASSTIINCHSRKYHGLLIATTDKPKGRFVLFSDLEDSISIHGKEIFLSTHKYPEVFHPQGYKNLKKFSLDLFPRLTYQIGDTILHKDLMLLYGENTALVRYSLEKSSSPVKIKIKPLLAFRGIHDLSNENLFLRPHTYKIENGFFISPYETMPNLYLKTSKVSSFFPSPQWYKKFEYIEEEQRGYPFHEDLFVPGVFEAKLSPGKDIILCCSIEEKKTRVARLWEKEEKRRQDQKSQGNKIFKKQGLAAKLYPSSAGFVIKNRKGNTSIIAGYHWFNEWGRDTLISLPGLTFSQGKIKEGVDILKRIGEQRKDGLIPNCISDAGIPSYNSVDASLWYFWCVQEFLRATNDYGLVKKEFWPALVDIVSQYMQASPEHVEVLENGLLRAGDQNTNLTWMDAKVCGCSMTPRHGCAVEINALWFNALCFVKDLAEKFGVSLAFDVEEIIKRIRESFSNCFWIEEGGYLADVWCSDTGERDESVRPNQIFAVSLPYSVLDEIKMKKVVEKVEEELLTPYGLRTLSPNDPMYRGIYQGSQEERDASYHQGTVWPWLFGHYGEALLKVSENKSMAKKKIKEILSHFENHLLDAGLNQISEIFDGDEPHEPRGCIAQAWSVAEILRISELLEAIQ